MDSEQTVANESTSASKSEMIRCETMTIKLLLQHMLKKASIEVQIWVRGTIKDLEPSRLKDRVSMTSFVNMLSCCKHRYIPMSLTQTVLKRH